MISNRPEIGQDMMRSCTALSVRANHRRVAIFFFALLGYFVGGLVLATRGEFSWYEHGMARFARLWLVLVPDLLQTSVIDKMPFQLTSEIAPRGYAGIWHLDLKSNGEYSVSDGIVPCAQGLLPGAEGLTTYLIWMCALSVLAWCFWFAFERRTYQIRQAFQKIPLSRPR